MTSPSIELQNEDRMHVRTSGVRMQQPKHLHVVLFFVLNVCMPKHQQQTGWRSSEPYAEEGIKSVSKSASQLTGEKWKRKRPTERKSK